MEYNDLRIGDKVVVVRSQQDYEDGWANTWVYKVMDELVNNGKIYTIKSFSKTGVFFEEENTFGFPWKSLELASDVSNKKEDESEKLHSMKLHETIEFENGHGEVKRVPGGWIYMTIEYGTDSIAATSCFVPFNNEFNKLIHDCLF